MCTQQAVLLFCVRACVSGCVSVCFTSDLGISVFHNDLTQQVPNCKSFFFLTLDNNQSGFFLLFPLLRYFFYFVRKLLGTFAHSGERSGLKNALHALSDKGKATRRRECLSPVCCSHWPRNDLCLMVCSSFKTNRMFSQRDQRATASEAVTYPRTV